MKVFTTIHKTKYEIMKIKKAKIVNTSRVKSQKISITEYRIIQKPCQTTTNGTAKLTIVWISECLKYEKV